MCQHPIGRRAEFGDVGRGLRVCVRFRVKGLGFKGQGLGFRV